MTTAGLRVLIVDDERPARCRIRVLFEAAHDVDVIGEAADGQTARRVIRDERPHVMFIDIRMPGTDGLTVVESLTKQTAPHVVFVTAFDEHAPRWTVCWWKTARAPRCFDWLTWSA